MGNGTFSANSEPAVLNSPIKNLFSGLDPWTTGTSSTTSSGIGYYGKNGICYAPSSITNNNPLLSYNGPGSAKINQGNSTDPSNQNSNNSGSWWDGGTLGSIAGTVMKNLNGIAGISNSILGWKQFSENRKLIAKQMENIDEQIAASKEYRQQRADEIARLNRVRKNTQKSFNTGTTITRSY